MGLILSFCNAAILTLSLLLSGCASTGGVRGNEDGSTPINEAERQAYSKAVMRCYKTGGTRVVKILGSLRCY